MIWLHVIDNSTWKLHRTFRLLFAKHRRLAFSFSYLQLDSVNQYSGVATKVVSISTAGATMHHICSPTCSPLEPFPAATATCRCLCVAITAWNGTDGKWEGLLILCVETATVLATPVIMLWNHSTDLPWFYSLSFPPVICTQETFYFPS